MRGKNILTPFLLIFIYLICLGLISMAVFVLGAPDSLLLLCMMAIIFVAFNYSRHVYVLMLILTAPPAIFFIAHQASDGILEPLQSVGIAALVVLGIGEYAYAVQQRWRNAEEELDRSAEQYRRVLDDIQDVAYVVDEQGVLQYISPAIERFSAYQPQELIGRHFADFVHPDDLSQALLRFASGYADEAQPVVTRIVDKDGRIKYVRASNRPIYTANQITGYRGILVDISDFIAAQRGLETRQRQLTLLNEITRAALVESQFTAMLQAFMDRLAELFEADGCVITLWDAGKKRPILANRPGGWDPQKSGLEPDEPNLSKTVLESGKPLVVEDVNCSLFHQSPETQHLEAHTLLGLPIRAEGNWLGAALITYQQPHEFSPDELAWAEVVADQVSLAVFKGWVLDRVQAQQEAADALRVAGITLGATLEYDEVLDRLLPQVQKVVPYECGVIMEIVDGTARVVRMWEYEKYYSPEVLQAIANLNLEIQATPNLRRLCETGEPYFIPDITQEEGWIPVPGITRLRSWAGVPILVKGEVVALYSLESAEVDYFQPEQLQLLTAFAAQASLALQNAQLYARARRQMKESETLRQASSAVVSEIDLERVLSRVLEQLEKVIPYDSASIFIAEGDRLRILAAKGFAQPDQVIGLEVSRYNPLFDEISRTRQPVILQDALADPRFSGWAGTGGYVRGWMGVPLMAQGEIIGELTVDSRRAGVYTHRDAQLVMDFATEASIALQHAGLYRQVVSMANRLSILHQASEQVSATLDPQQLYEAIHNAAAQVMPTESFVISVLDDYQHDIEIVYMVDRLGRIPLTRIPADSGLSGYIIRTGKSICVNDETDNLEFEALQFGDPNPVQSFLAVPLRRQDGGIFGMVSAQSYQIGAYTPADLKLLELLATHAAVALDNTRLFGELQRLAIIDDLTGLFNRRHFFEVARLEFERARRYRRPLSIIMLDIDHFKNVNDRLGHLVGDQVLRVVAQRCRENLRDSDVIGRYGGEEFIMLLPETDIEGTRHMAERLKVAIGDIPIYARNETVLVTISIGLATISMDCNDLDQLISMADDALYSAKGKGRNSVDFHSGGN